MLVEVVGRDDNDSVGVVFCVSFIFEEGVEFVYFFRGEHKVGDDGEVLVGWGVFVVSEKDAQGE